MVQRFRCTFAEDEYAFNWLEEIRKRYPNENIRIEPAPGATPTFPVGEEDEVVDPTEVTIFHCPHCGGVKASTFSVLFKPDMGDGEYWDRELVYSGSFHLTAQTELKHHIMLLRSRSATGRLSSPE